ncbi:MAG: helicase-exonuclease AddAB subunit AddA, partial [Clostridiales bacterium]|nr:helicase-exonuclease AddAB subunit AddA [Clostridiales bacterium]
PVDIDRLVVVTFTEAAASEMRQRISNKLAEAREADPENERLARQFMLIPGANISTVHAFCRKLMKRFFHIIDLDPEFKVGDETELQVLRYQILDEVFENEYSKEDNAAFTDLVESYGGGKTRDDGLADLILRLYEFVESSPYPEYMLKRYTDMYDKTENDLDESIWTDMLRGGIRRELDGALAAVRQCIKLSLEPAGPVKYLDVLYDDETQVLYLLNLTDESLAEIHDALRGVAFKRLHTYRGAENSAVSETLKNMVKNLRDTEYKERLQKLKTEYFFKHPDDMARDVKSLRGPITALTGITLTFMRLYAEAKRERGIVDFNDLEHYCIDILLTGGPNHPEPTAAAHELSDLFEEVMIDEYQDSNAVQELILSAISHKRFMVGDVKQSIYKFRRANPYLFIDKYERFGDDDKAPGFEATPGYRVDLSMNFRSRADILNAANFFFSRIMTKEVGETVYDSRAALYPGLAFPAEPVMGMYAAEFDLIEYIKRDNEPEENEGEPLADISKASAEAAVIGQRILSFINPDNPLMVTDSVTKELRPCKKSDIVILLRSVGAIGRVITEELKKLDIDARSGVGTDFFESVEVLTALSLLRIIDNPRQDVHLITALHSPICGFTPDELLDIRYMDVEKSFFECVEISGNPKVEKFLADLSRWRDKAVYMPISHLLSMVLTETGYYNIAGALPGGVTRQANLRELLDRAARYEETTFNGLFHFIRYMDRLRKSGAEIRVAESADVSGEDQVAIMTIHKSKGLEFPVVFVSMLGKQFNRLDEREAVIFHQDMGIGAVYVNTESRVKTETLPRFAVSRRIRMESLSEELRVLYVAITRARDKLVLTGCVERLEKRLEKWRYAAAISDKTLPVFYRAECRSFLDFLAPCLADALTVSREGLYTADGARFDIKLLSIRSRALVKHEEERLTESRFDALADINAGRNNSGRESEIARTLWGAYTHAPDRNFPSKVSISEVKRLYYVETAGETELAPRPRPVFSGPKFLRKEIAEAKMYRGTVIHTVMEHLDLHRQRDAQGVKSLISGLIAANILPEDAEPLIPINKIVSFANSPLADRIRQSPDVRRETPFVMGLPAKEVYRGSGSEEIILLHGVIDCWFKENGGIVIVDYKSDALPSGGVSELIDKYRVQMAVYAKAVERVAGQPPLEMLLYLFAAGMAVDVGSHC